VPPVFADVLSLLYREIMLQVRFLVVCSSFNDVSPLSFTMTLSQRSLWLRLSYTQDRLRIGWGSVRVGLGGCPLASCLQVRSFFYRCVTLGAQAWRLGI